MTIEYINQHQIIKINSKYFSQSILFNIETTLMK